MGPLTSAQYPAPASAMTSVVAITTSDSSPSMMASDRN
jgi:hypothetical protein